MANRVGIKVNGMQRSIKIKQTGDGRKTVKLAVTRNTKIKIKKS